MTELAQTDTYPTLSIHERVTSTIPLAAALLGLLGCELPTDVTDSEGTAEATSLQVQPSSVTLAPDGTAELEATALDADGNSVSGYSISWSTGDSSVANVEADGTVTAKASGTTAITATAQKDGHELSGRSGVTVEDGSGSGGSGSGSLVSDVQPTAYEQDTLETGIAVYIDREYTVDEVPSGYGGWHYVRPANDDKSATGDSVIQFTLADSATVALAYDERAAQHPSWLGDWTATGDVLRTSNVDHDVFTRAFGPGTVVLGGNLSSGAEGAQTNYVLFAAPTDSSRDDDGGGDGDSTQDSVASVTISPSAASISAIGGSVQFSAQATDGDGNTISVISFTWSSSNAVVASVDAEGLVTAHDEGSAQIVVAAKGHADSATITVDTTSTDGSDVSTEVWGRADISLQASGVSGNPFEVILDGVFTHESSGTTIRMPGYYDGNDTWKVKFMPTRAGEWSYRTESPVAALDGVSGTVTADPSSSRGMLRADPSHPTKWQFADGSYVLPVELRVEFFSEPGTLSEFEAAADALVQGGALMMDTRLTEEQGMFEGGRHDFIFEGNWQDHQFDLDIWQRMDQRMEALAERGLGAHIMFYSDDSGAPGWSGQSETERLVLRYAVARLAPYPVLFWNTAIDVAEVRSDADIDWMGQQLKSLDPYDHPRSSRRGGGSGSIVMDNETFYSLGAPTSPVMSDLIQYLEDTPGLPVGFDDAWIENWSGGSRPNHTPSDIRRAGWKSLVAGGGAFIIRGGADGLSVDGGYYSLHTVESDWESDQWLSFINPFLRNQLGQHWPDMTSAQGLADGTHIYALADPDRDRIVYLAVGANDSVDTGGGGNLTLMLSGESGNWNGTWFDPRDGSTSSAGAFDGGQDHTVPPPSNDDWILLLTKN